MPGIENFAPERTDTNSGFLYVAEFCSSRIFELGKVTLHLTVDGGGRFPALLVVKIAGFGRHRETRRHWQSGIGHLGEVRALASEQPFHVAVAVGFAAAEEIHELTLAGSARFGARSFAAAFPAGGRRSRAPPGAGSLPPSVSSSLLLLTACVPLSLPSMLPTPFEERFPRYPRVGGSGRATPPSAQAVPL